MYKFKPILKSLVWGGDKIAAYKGISTTQSTIGESWELSGMAGSESEVAEGPDKGKRLPELIRRDRGELVGEQVYSRFGDHFPLLVKFIDAREDLSLQVHPNEGIARQRHHPAFLPTHGCVRVSDGASRQSHSGAGRVIPIRAVSESRKATIAPRMRKAAGSPKGLRPTHSTAVPRIRPISWSRRRISPVWKISPTVAASPGAREFIYTDVFI